MVNISFVMRMNNELKLPLNFSGRHSLAAMLFQSHNVKYLMEYEKKETMAKAFLECR